MLGRDWIVAHIPHQDAMCLIDEVLSWSTERIACRAASHRLDTNPLRREGRLGASCAIEYAAQAMAIHGALLGNEEQKARPGVLVSVRGVEFSVDRVDDVAEDLEIEAEQMVAEKERVLYQFTVRAGVKTLCSGRATVVLALELP